MARNSFKSESKSDMPFIAHIVFHLPSKLKSHLEPSLVDQKINTERSENVILEKERLTINSHRFKQ